MDTQTPQNPILEPAQPVSQTPVKPVKAYNFLVLLLSVLLIITVAIAGLFYFQIQKLSKELARLQVQVQPTPAPVAKIDCKDPRPEVCTLECIQNPPYICGSDGKSYCTVCQACSNKDIAWYEMKNSPCEER